MKDVWGVFGSWAIRIVVAEESWKMMALSFL